MAFKTTIAQAILNKLLKGTDFTDGTDWDVSLHTADPGQTGANEVTAGGNAYARQEPTFDTISDNTATTTADLTWTNMPAVTVTHVGLWWYITDTWYFIWGGSLSASKAVGAGDTFKIAAGDLDVTLT